MRQRSKKLKRKPEPKRFLLSKKLVVQVRYYETMYMIHDKQTGDRVFTGSDPKVARAVLGALKRSGQ